MTSRRFLNPLASRRSAWMVAGAATLVAAVTGLTMLFRTMPKAENANIDNITTQAVHCHSRQDYGAVVEALTPHWANITSDTETLHIYADACLRVPQPGNAHVAEAIKVYQQIAEQAPQDGEAARRLFELGVRTGDADLAMRFGKRSVKLFPNDSGLRLSFARELLDQRELQAALALVDQALKLDPQNIIAYTTKIRVLLEMQTSESDILTFIRQSARESKSISQTELMLAYFDATGDVVRTHALLDKASEELMGRHAAAASGHTQETTKWLVHLFERNQRPAEALQLLKGSQEALDDPRSLQRGLFYRHWQRGDYGVALETIAQIERREPLADEMLVNRILCLLFLNDKPSARKNIEQLPLHSTQLATTWKRVLDPLARERVDGSELLHATRRALQTYPQSAYLLHLSGTAFELLIEDDMALEFYRKAIRYSPRWIAPRIAAARLLLKHDRPGEAFAVAATALEVNPQLSGAFEVVMLASVSLLADDTPLSASQKHPLLETLQTVVDTTTDDGVRLPLQVIQAKIIGNDEKSDALIQQLLDHVATPDSATLDVLYALADSESLRRSIQELAATAPTSTLDAELAIALELAEQHGLQRALDHLNQFEDPNDDSRRSRELLIGELLSRTESKDAMSHWLRLSETYANDARVQQLALSQAATSQDREAQRQIIARMKAMTGGAGASWKLANAKWLLSGDEQEKNAAVVVLQMTALIKEAPTCEQAYRLLAEAYHRLDQPQKSCAALFAAIEADAATAETRIQLAECLADTGQLERAVKHAHAAGIVDSMDKDVEEGVRHRAIRILLKAEAFQQATEVVDKILPREVRDSDFALMGAYTMAMARRGRTEMAEPRLEKMAQANERWYDLWLDAAVEVRTPIDVALRWLDAAESWLTGDGDSRRRRLARAWAVLGARYDEPSHFESAIRVLAPFVETGDSLEASLQMASLRRRTGQVPTAIQIYETILDQDCETTMRAGVANNLAVLLSANPESLERAETLATEAVTIMPRPEFVDTLADLLGKQGRLEDAIQLLATQTQNHPESLLLQLRLAESLLASGNVAQARETMKRIESLSVEEPQLSLWRRLNDLRSSLADQE